MASQFERRAQAEQELVADLPSDRVPVLTAEAQSRLSWARPVRSPDDMPAAYREPVRAILGGAELAYAVIAPTFAGHIRRQTETLVLGWQGVIHVLRRVGQQVTVVEHRIDDLVSIELGIILLDSWVSFRSPGTGGVTTVSTVACNAVTLDLFMPFVAHARAASRDQVPVDRAREVGRLEWLRDVSLKYLNVGRDVVRPRDRVLDAVYQPQIRLRRAIGGRLGFGRTVSLAHLVVLTDAELIIAADSAHAPSHGTEGRHGSVRTFIAHERLGRASVDARSDGFQAVQLDLPGGEPLELVFAEAARPALARFLLRLAEVAPRTAR